MEPMESKETMESMESMESMEGFQNQCEEPQDPQEKPQNQWEEPQEQWEDPQDPQDTVKKRFSAQTVRAIVQLISFLLVPGLFIMVFSGIGEIYKAAIGGTFSFSGQIGNIILVASVFIITAIWGRFFCGFVCSFGAMQDLFTAIGRKLPFKVKVSEKADHILKYLKYLVLAFIVIVVWTLGTTGIKIRGISADTVWSPWTIFGMYASPWKGLPTQAWFLSVGGVLLLAIIIGSLLVERFFCRYLCPLGALLAAASKFRIFTMKRDTVRCGGACEVCGACARSCAMAIPVNESESIKSGECINCMKCAAACEAGCISADLVPAVSGTLAVAAIAGLAFVGTNALIADAETKVPNQSRTEKHWGNKGNGKSNPGSKQHGQRNFSDPKDGVSPQTPDNDSGGTEITPPAENTPPADNGDNSENQNNQAPADNSQAPAENGASGTQNDTTAALKDGTYKGTGSGFRGTTSVTVTVENGKITDIKVDSYQDDERFFTDAENGVIPEIISSQTPNVDAVSGATFSSNSIMEAVADAIGQEYTGSSGNSNSSPGTRSKGRKGSGRHGMQGNEGITNNGNGKEKDGTITTSDKQV